ncbi:NAD(P)H-binding protein [Nonomuraea ferruginea]
MILVTGVSGKLGSAILAGLRAVDGLVTVGASSSGDGAVVRLADFDRPETLEPAFAGVDVLVFVSAGYAEDDVVLARHGAVVRAATAAGVRHVIYTSLAQLGGAAHDRARAPLDRGAAGRGALRRHRPAQRPVRRDPGRAGRGRGRRGGGERGVRRAARRRAAVGRRTRRPGRRGRAGGGRGAGGPDVGGRRGRSGGTRAARTSWRAWRRSAGGSSPRRWPRPSAGPSSTGRAPLGETRASLAGLEPYQVGHTMSTFSNIGAGLLESRGGDLTAFLDAPRPVRDLVTAAVKSALGG